MKILSLFDGMSCGQIALNRCGIAYDNYYASEIDKYAIKVTQANYPNTIQIGDVRNVTAASLPKIDLLIGGSPCQGFSFAGKGLNFDDPRSKLFFEYVRLFRECNPKYFLLENVKMKKEYQSVISSYIGCDPIEINSALVSAQNRKRLYWTNIPVNELPQDKGILLKDIIQENVSEKYTLSQIAINRIIRKKWSMPNIDPKKTETILTKNNSGQLSVDAGTTLIRCIASRGRYNEYGKVNQNYEPREDFKTNSLTGVQKDNILQKGDIVRRLTELECERLQTVPDNYTNHVSSTQRYKMLGNGWTVDVICHILKHMDL